MTLLPEVPGHCLMLVVIHAVSSPESSRDGVGCHAEGSLGVEPNISSRIKRLPRRSELLDRLAVSVFGHRNLCY